MPEPALQAIFTAARSAAPDGLLQEGRVMPVYEAECKKCRKQEDYFASIAQREKLLPKCCGKRMQQIITRACFGFVKQDIAYKSPATGKVITTHRERLDDMRRSRSRPWEGYEQETKEAARRRKYREDKSEQKLEEAARRAWHQLPSSKRKALEGSE
jgi:predicted nucleic acid-binding Zn ribbon protein